MSAPLHLNLLNDQERLSSSPVRPRVMLPLLVGLAVAGLGVWLSLLCFRLHAAVQQKAALETRIAELKPALDHVVQLRAREKEGIAVLRQLGFYRNARRCFGETLLRLPDHVPDTIQLSELRVPLPPPLPPPAPGTKVPPLGPTNVSESVTLQLAGRAGGGKPSEAIKTLLEALRTPVFSNLVHTAEIPKGAFRLDNAREPSKRDTLLFEIICDCGGRKFE